MNWKCKGRIADMLLEGIYWITRYVRLNVFLLSVRPLHSRLSGKRSVHRRLGCDIFADIFIYSRCQVFMGGRQVKEASARLWQGIDSLCVQLFGGRDVWMQAADRQRTSVLFRDKAAVIPRMKNLTANRPHMATGMSPSFSLLSSQPDGCGGELQARGSAAIAPGMSRKGLTNPGGVGYGGEDGGNC